MKLMPYSASMKKQLRHEIGATEKAFLKNDMKPTEYTKIEDTSQIKGEIYRLIFQLSICTF